MWKFPGAVLSFMLGPTTRNKKVWQLKREAFTGDTQETNPGREENRTERV